LAATAGECLLPRGFGVVEALAAACAGVEEAEGGGRIDGAEEVEVGDVIAPTGDDLAGSSGVVENAGSTDGGGVG
jgi:hypothetical protein